MNKKHIPILLICSVLILPCLSRADSNHYIKRMINSPASKFDLYIYRLSEKLKCRKDRVSMSKTTQARTPCLTDIEYDQEGNVLLLYFYIDSSHKEMRNFKIKSDKRREKTLLKLLRELSVELGVEGQKFGNEMIKLGTIQMTPLTYSANTVKTTNEEIQFYKEIAHVTEINLITNIGSKVYKATRTKSGSYRYQVDKMEK